MEQFDGSDLVTITITGLPREVKEAVVAEAKANHRSMAAQFRLILCNHIAREAA
jgi:plasmid stability protein